MTKYRETLDRVFHALSDGTRRAIVARLVHGPASVSHLAEPLDLALPTVMQHLGVLEDAGIVASHKIGRTRTVQLVPDAFVDANAWLLDHRLPQEQRLDRLGHFLTPTQDQETPT